MADAAASGHPQRMSHLPTSTPPTGGKVSRLSRLVSLEERGPSLGLRLQLRHEIRHIKVDPTSTSLTFFEIPQGCACVLDMPTRH